MRFTACAHYALLIVAMETNVGVPHFWTAVVKPELFLEYMHEIRHTTVVMETKLILESHTSGQLL